MFLANVAREPRAEGDAGTAILLALTALPDALEIVRPYVTEAQRITRFARADRYQGP